MKITPEVARKTIKEVRSGIGEENYKCFISLNDFDQVKLVTMIIRKVKREIEIKEQK